MLRLTQRNLKRLLQPHTSEIYAGTRLRLAHFSTEQSSGAHAAARLPLSGVRVLDLTRVLAGPFCTMMLGDLGADVIKVENPKVGDETREWGPPFFDPSKMNPVVAERLGLLQQVEAHKQNPTLSEPRGESTYYLALNRNKRSIALDMKRGRDIVLELVKKCDILVENYQPGKLDAMGLGYEDIKKVKKDIIYASITGYGASGPLSALPGYDVMASSMGGLVGLTGTPAEPARPGAAVVDVITGLNMQASILAAFLDQQRQKRQYIVNQAVHHLNVNNTAQTTDLLRRLQGDYVTLDGLNDFPDSFAVHLETSLYESQIAALANLAMSYLGAGTEAARRGTAHGSIVPYQCFKVQPEPDATAAGQTTAFMAIGAMNDHQFVNLTKVLGMPELASDPRFKTNPLRVKHREELLPLLSAVIEKHPASYWQPKFVAANIPAAPVNTLKQVFEHPHTWAREMVKAIPYPAPKGPNTDGKADNSDRQLPILGSAVKSSSFQFKPRYPPPYHGQHTIEILQSLTNLTSSEIAQLQDQGVILQHPGFAPQ